MSVHVSNHLYFEKVAHGSYRASFGDKMLFAYLRRDYTPEGPHSGVFEWWEVKDKGEDYEEGIDSVLYDLDDMHMSGREREQVKKSLERAVANMVEPHSTLVIDVECDAKDSDVDENY